MSGLLISCSEDPITPNQELSISGTVYDEDTDDVLKDCRVTIISTFVFVKTDSSGRFVFDSLDFRENYSLRIEKSGYEDQTITLSFAPDGVSERDIEVRLSLDRLNNNEPELPNLIFPISDATDVML
ncbi:MAG: carboxypeptidase regulatory-like domain-containing protein, partial [Saprospiraceae bacterium]|nr:carboxypeptidase regulatory-like domain-containing protein [Saprospiraceae bacterium]